MGGEACSAWGGEAPGACNYLTGEYRGNRSGLLLEVHRERIGSHGHTLQPGELLLDGRQSWVALVLATVKGRERSAEGSG